ncbi:hypothetical protein HMPREF1486_03096 [Streptomyces sp. HPH0547]|uniref:hypothetical protein n=1 Tax=Streptomyces sp. HPH0547 TaxID=1203592 RepID=UPI00034E1870|nr:hypothetical protein [Streptomyces sp. HPH0547]EPD94543.1 hypothetical protein HMPREF1486_03096 [Streptomyces sp. HPH0547]
MPGSTDPRYYLPQEPADPGREYMTIQETAWILGMGVRRARELYREAGFERGKRKKIMTNRAERQRMHELNNQPSARRPVKRRKLAAA